MNGSTEPAPASLTSSNPFRFFAGSVLLLVIVAGTKYNIIPVESVRSALGFLLAPVTAGTVTVKQAISEFGGYALSSPGIMVYVSSYASLCAVFVIGPVLYIGLRTSIQRYRMEGKTPPMAYRFSFGVIAAWCVLLPVLIIATVFASESVFSNMKNDNMISRYRDQATKQMTIIAFKAQQFFFLPSAEGGGSGSFKKGQTTVSLKDLGFKERTPLGRFVLYKGAADTTLQLLFFGNTASPTNQWEQHGIEHLIEYDMTINPSHYMIKKTR